MSITSAVQIVEKVGEKYVLKEEALNRILQQKSVVNKKIAVLTVAGAFRKGKSFFLSNCVRYLQSKKDGSDWMASTASVTGFTWRRSTNSVTEGILMWPEPFIVQNAIGEEVAILLMDTEGAFDHKSSMSQCATVFALSALLSSVLVYNVMQDIQEDTLNHLQFFAKYGSYALDEEHANSPFQSLLFLVRDWQNDDDFGMEAGRRLLDEKFKSHASSNTAMLELRKDIKRSFIDIKCSLLPHPGTKISKGSEGAITVDDMDPDFKDELSELVPYMVEQLIRPKDIGGKQIKGNEFLDYFKMYVALFGSGKVPEPKSIYDATAEVTHQSALDTALEHYNTTMRKKFSQLAERQYFEESKLKGINEEVTHAAIKIFTETKKMGSLPKFLDSLKDKIEDRFRNDYLKDNQSRIELEKERKEKEEAERKRIEQAEIARKALAEKERQKEEMRIKMEREKEEAERRRKEEERRHREQMELARKEREESERSAREEQERREREWKRQMEKEREEREEAERRNTERLRKQMEQMRLEAEEEHKREMGRERQRRQDSEREAREAAAQLSFMFSNQMPQQCMPQQFMPQNFMPQSFMQSPCSSSGYDNFAPSYSNASRAGTPSGRSAGRPRGSVMERFDQGILPREGTRDYARLQRDGFL